MPYKGAGVGLLAVIGDGDMGFCARYDGFEAGDVACGAIPLREGIVGQLLGDKSACVVVVQQVEVPQLWRRAEEVGLHYRGQRMGDDIVLDGDIVAEGVADVEAVLDFVDGDAAFSILVQHVGKHQHPVVDEAHLEEHHFARLRQQPSSKHRILHDIAFESVADVDAMRKSLLKLAFEVAPLPESRQRGGRITRQAGVVDFEPQPPLALQPSDVFALA